LAIRRYQSLVVIFCSSNLLPRLFYFAFSKQEQEKARKGVYGRRFEGEKIKYTKDYDRYDIPTPARHELKSNALNSCQAWDICRNLLESFPTASYHFSPFLRLFPFLYIHLEISIRRKEREKWLAVEGIPRRYIPSNIHFTQTLPESYVYEEVDVGGNLYSS
jgi:hypothetical protein